MYLWHKYETERESQRDKSERIGCASSYDPWNILTIKESNERQTISKIFVLFNHTT